MVTFIAHSDGKVLVPEDQVDLAPGAKYRVTIEPADEADKPGLPLLDFALACASKMRGNYPTDLAKNHDHYLHGRPKRK